MNWLNKLLLRFFLLPKKFYTKLGCNMQHLEAIVTVKLMMDDRRASSFHQARKQNNHKEINNATIWGMLGSLFMGLFYLMIFLASDSDVTNMTLFFTFFIILLSLTLITDFTNVLLDVRDNFIILPKPVSDKTFVLARLLHIIIHICKMIVPLCVPVTIYIGVSKGFSGVLILVPLILLATLFTVFVINAFYLVLLKITTPEKFKNLITYIQIAFAIVIYGASQILPRIIGKTAGNFNIEKFSWIKLLPTYWFGNTWNSLYTLNFNNSGVLFLLLTIFIPITSIWIVVKYFAPSFNQKLTLISTGNAESNVTKSSKENTSKRGYSFLWANLITKNGNERVGFQITWKMMLRSRDFKMKVYPGIGYMFVLFFVIFLQKRKLSLSGLKSAIAQQSASGKWMLLLIVYFSSLMIITALGGIVMSDKYKAAWIYFVTPISKPGEIISGSIKAVIVMFFVPIAVLAFLISLGIVGFTVLPNILLAICNQLLIIAIMAFSSVNYLPFSTSVYKPSFSSVLKNILMMMLGGLVGIVHYFIYPYTWLVLLLIILSLACTYFLFGIIKKYSWQKIISSYTES